MSKIIDTRHPLYMEHHADWCKWRRTYEGGDKFINYYLKKFSDRETDAEFEDRKLICFNPAYAQSAIDDIKNAIFERTIDVSRTGGPISYVRCSQGLDDGVDLNSSSMGTLIGTEILPELLVLSKVGVLVDNFRDLGSTLRDKEGKRPYVSIYHAEDILNWSPLKPLKGYNSLLLREWVEDFDTEYQLPTGMTCRYRHYLKTQFGVTVTIFDADGQIIDRIDLDLDRIPFTPFQIPLSLMRNIAEYQIALLNVESSDIQFIRKANFPFYYEFYDPKTELQFAKTVAPGDDGGVEDAKVSKDKEIKVGLTKGRRIAKGVEPPAFIGPPGDVLRVSMEKGEQLKEDIRLLVNLNLVNMNPRRQSADSKEMDQGGLQASLAFIGLVLERGEMSIAEDWKRFEGSKDPVTIKYPKTYNIETKAERRSEAKDLKELSYTVPSATFKKQVAKKIANLVVGSELTHEDLQKVHREIDTAETLTSDPDIIMGAQKAGLIGDVSASNALGFKGEIEVEKAKKDRAERVALVLEQQQKSAAIRNDGAARGAPELGGKTGEDEKEGKPGRGPEAKLDK